MKQCTLLIKAGLVALALSFSSIDAAQADMKSARKLYNHGDRAAALIEFSRLAKAGNAEAQAQLGEMYFTGRGAAENQGLALKWFMAAAEQGDVGSQVSLGLILLQNSEFESAAKWFGLAAAQGDTDAMKNMAALMMRGMGVEQNIPAAVRTMIQVAELGDPDNQLQLGMVYLRGLAGAPDIAKGLEWMTRAAEQGYADAQYQLADELMKNGADAKDANERQIQAYKWYQLAAMQGTENASVTLIELAGKLTEKQIAEGKRRASSWQPVSNK